MRSTEVLSGRTEKYQKADGSSGYDALNRLTNADYGDGETQGYTFDAMGSRLSRVDSAAGTTNSTYNATNMLLSTGGYGASGFQNDADGNTVSGNGRTNAWNSQNRLVSCIINGSTSIYKYGADGLRRQKTTNGATTDYAYDGTMMVREGHASGGNLSQVTATYFQGASGPCYRRDDTATEIDSQGRTVTKARWYVYDGLGSVVGEVDPLGNLTSSPKYDVYGAVRANPGTATSKQGFVGGLGHVSDDTGLVYMRARYMDPQTGRFVSEDPGKQGPNWFAYCHDNPVRFTDQSGKAAGDWVMLGDGLLTLGFQAALLCQFLIAIHSTEDSSDVEEDWNKFCEGYKQADPLFGEKNERGDEENIVISTYLGAKGATEEGSLSGGMMTIASGATAGAGLAVLIYGYEARVNWYAGRCDGD